MLFKTLENHMQSRFLCPNHRQWLISHPRAALSNLAKTQDTATYYRERGLFEQALPYDANAYETAEIVLTTRAEEVPNAAIAMTSCAILLADTYRKLGQGNTANNILISTQNRLQAEYTLLYQQKASQNCVLDCIKALTFGEQTQQLLEKAGTAEYQNITLH
jgi:hypothetical protein